MAKGWTLVSVAFLLVAALMVALYWTGYIESQGFGYWVQFVAMVLIGLFVGLCARSFEEKDRPMGYSEFVQVLKEAEKDG